MTLEQALKILGGNFAKCTVNKNRAYSNKEDGGLSICFRYSRKYEGNVWWTSESPLTIDGTEFIIIALQHYLAISYCINIGLTSMFLH